MLSGVTGACALIGQIRVIIQAECYRVDNYLAELHSQRQT